MSGKASSLTSSSEGSEPPSPAQPVVKTTTSLRVCPLLLQCPILSTWGWYVTQGQVCVCVFGVLKLQDLWLSSSHYYQMHGHGVVEPSLHSQCSGGYERRISSSRCSGLYDKTLSQN